jgi:CubicO group peptidase (beta-lactamase class C family)
MLHVRFWRSLVVACALIGSVAPAFAQTATSAAAAAQQLVFPDTAWARIDNPQSVGWSAAGLAVVREHLSSLPTTGFVAIVGGRVLMDYGDVARVTYLASVRKSVLSMLYGIYHERGRIDLKRTLAQIGIDDIGGLTSVEKQATVLDLLTARSGIYHAASNAGDDLANAPPRGSQKPGTYYLYSNWDFNTLGTIFRKETGVEIYDALEQELARPLRFQDFNRASHRLSGDTTLSIHRAYHMNFSTRDMARIGYLMLREGNWAGKQIVPRDWVRESTRAFTPRSEMNPADRRSGLFGYGYLWWVFDDAALPPAYKGAYAGLGAYGQHILVMPALDLVVAHKTDSDNGSVSNNQFFDVISLLVQSNCLSACARPTLAAPSPRTLAARLDSLAGSGVVENRVAGTVAAVVRGNDTLLFKGYGRMDVESNAPMSMDAMFEIGALTKQFTAVAILRLRDDGKLSLDDDITKWLPDFDTRGNRIPLRRLLDHTSGIVGLSEMAALSRDSAYALIKRQPLQFRTGDAQVYSNYAFWLLGLVIEKASGMSYADYVEKNIFESLGMKRSMYCSSSENIAHRAHGHLIQDGVTRRAPANVHTSWPFSAGSLCSTAGDVVTWLTALHGGRVLSPKSYAELVTPSRLNDGTPIRYAMGLSVRKDIRGLDFIGHGGSIAGFTVHAAWYPDAQMAVVVLLNSTGDIDPGAVASELAGEVLPWRPPPRFRFQGDAAPFVGRYVGPSRGGDMVIDVTYTPQDLAISVNGAPARPLPWLEGFTFRLSSSVRTMGSTFLTFRRETGATGPMTELRFDSGDGYYILKRQQR